MSMANCESATQFMTSLDPRHWPLVQVLLDMSTRLDAPDVLPAGAMAAGQPPWRNFPCPMFTTREGASLVD